jgi:hypothetical protein
MTTDDELLLSAFKKVLAGKLFLTIHGPEVRAATDWPEKKVTSEEWEALDRWVHSWTYD